MLRTSSSSKDSVAKLVTMGDGVVVTFKGFIPLTDIHAWSEKLVTLGKINWAIINVTDLRGVESTGWKNVEMGIKKLKKRGMQRFVIVYNDSDTFKLFTKFCKNAGVFSMMEYIDTRKRDYNQTKVVTFLKENWDKKK
ncbi:hypothetical protein GF324_04735 [bacterium]|nr:hypothetical protein [bacterium]